MLKFDVIQVFINASAAIGISVLWFEFIKKVFKKRSAGLRLSRSIGQIKTSVMRKKKKKVRIISFKLLWRLFYLTMSDNTALPTRQKTMPDNTALSTREKTISILLDSSAILALGAYCFWLNKRSFNFALSLFDHMVDVIETPTEKETE